MFTFGLIHPRYPQYQVGPCVNIYDPLCIDFVDVQALHFIGLCALGNLALL